MAPVSVRVLANRELHHQPRSPLHSQLRPLLSMLVCWRKQRRLVLVIVAFFTCMLTFFQGLLRLHQQAIFGNSDVVSSPSVDSPIQTISTTILLPPSKQQHNIKVLLTNYGWNSLDPTVARDRFRSLRSKAMLEAIQRHAHFDALLWHNITTGQVAPDPNTHYYIFLDLETCLEKNWPNYGRRLDGNTDVEHNRSTIFRWTASCQALKAAATSVLFTSNCCWAKMVLMDCGGFGPEMCLARPQKQQEQEQSKNDKRKHVLPSQGKSWYALASISAHVDQIDLSLDQGLPPPPILTTIPQNLQQEQEQQPWQHDNTVISTMPFLGQTDWDMNESQPESDYHKNNATAAGSSSSSSSIICQKNRPVLLYFAGNFRSNVRKELRLLHDPQKSIITNPDYRKLRKGGFQLFYQQLLQANFGAVPRGDNLFSYRFTEVLAAGAIPVVYADGWVLPFRPELVDWATCCAVIIPEADLNRTYDILSNISAKEQCRLRRNGQRVFHQYMKTTDGVISGILQGLELVAHTNYRNQPKR